MINAENLEGRTNQARCSPRSFFRGIYLLTKNFFHEMAGTGAILVFSALLVSSRLLEYPSASALCALISLLICGSCAALAYIGNVRRNILSIVGVTAVMCYLYFALWTAVLVQTKLSSGANGWTELPIMVKAAIAPLLGLGVLVYLAVGVGAIAAVVWVGLKVPKAVRTAMRYICHTGQVR